jgi:zinc transporter
VRLPRSPGRAVITLSHPLAFDRPEQVDDIAIMAIEPVEAVSGAPESGIMWVYHFGDDGTAASLPCEGVEAALAADTGWTWVHVGLADARARAWLTRQAPVSEIAREVLTGSDDHLRLDIAGGEFVGVMPDLHRSFAHPTDDLVRLRFAMTGRLLITARRQAVHALELTRRSIEAGRTYPTPFAFVDTIIDQFVDAIGKVNATLGDELDEIEGRLLREDLGDERQRIGRIRLQAARMHRQLAQLHTLFHRLEARAAAENRQFGRGIRALAQKIDAIRHDSAVEYERARLLLDEISGRMAEITNRSLFTLSMLTACLLPPTLVTGFFGMNTKDLPFQDIAGGTWWALIAAAAAGGIAYWLLARMRAL